MMKFGTTECFSLLTCRIINTTTFGKFRTRRSTTNRKWVEIVTLLTKTLVNHCKEPVRLKQENRINTRSHVKKVHEKKEKESKPYHERKEVPTLTVLLQRLWKGNDGTWHEFKTWTTWHYGTNKPKHESYGSEGYPFRLLGSKIVYTDVRTVIFYNGLVRVMIRNDFNSIIQVHSFW